MKIKFLTKIFITFSLIHAHNASAIKEILIALPEKETTYITKEQFKQAREKILKLDSKKIDKIKNEIKSEYKEKQKKYKIKLDALTKKIKTLRSNILGILKKASLLEKIDTEKKEALKGQLKERLKEKRMEEKLEGQLAEIHKNLEKTIISEFKEIGPAIALQNIGPLSYSNKEGKRIRILDVLVKALKENNIIKFLQEKRNLLEKVTLGALPVFFDAIVTYKEILKLLEQAIKTALKMPEAKSIRDNLKTSLKKIKEQKTELKNLFLKIKKELKNRKLNILFTKDKIIRERIKELRTEDKSLPRDKPKYFHFRKKKSQKKE